MLHSRSVHPVGIMGTPQARPAIDPHRHARLFELLRQQSLGESALLRLHRRVTDAGPLPSPALLAASLVDQSSRATS